MKPKVFAGMLVAVLVLGLLYAYVEKGRESSYASNASSAPLLPALSTSINDAHSLKIEHKDKTYTITRAEKGWGMDTKNGYPVDAGKVRSLLLALKDARPIEEKTSDPALYDQIGVEEPSAPESESTRVTVLDASGKELASVIVGDRRESKGGMSRSGGMPSEAYYVRRNGEAESWLVEAKLLVEPEEGRWLDRTILNVDRNRLRAVEIKNADGERVFASKASKDATNFDVAALPEGRELKYAGVANTLGSALSNLTLEDVVPAGDIAFDEPPTASTTFWTFDGLRVDVTVQERDEKLYAKFDASFDDAGATAAGAPVPPPPPPPEPAPVEGEASEESTPLDPIVTTPEVPPGPTPEEVEKEVGEIRARAGTWVYVLPTWKKSSFVKRMDEFLKELTPPAEEGAPPAFEDLDGLEELLQDQTTGTEDDGTTSEPPPPPAEEPKDDGDGTTSGEPVTDDDGAQTPPADEPKPDEPPPDEPKPEEPPPKDDGDGDGDGGR